MAEYVERELCGHRLRVVVPASIGFPKHGTQEFEDDEPMLGPFADAIRPAVLVVDAGAQFGNYALVALARGARVVAYEPSDEARVILRENVEANGFADRFVLRAECLWDGTEYPSALCMEVFGAESPYSARSIATARLDDDVPGIVDHLKLDVEGAELGALLGARKILERCRPTVWVEIHDGAGTNEVGQYPVRIRSAGRIRELLVGLGYEIEELTRGVQRWWVARNPGSAQ